MEEVTQLLRQRLQSMLKKTTDLDIQLRTETITRVEYHRQQYEIGIRLNELELLIDCLGSK